MSAVTLLAQDRFWTDKAHFDTAERRFYENLGKEAQLNKTNGAAHEDDSAEEEEEDSGYAAISKSLDVELAMPAVALPAATKANKLKKSKKSKEAKALEVTTHGAADDVILVSGSTNSPPAVDAKASAKKSKKKNKNAAKKEKLAMLDKENAGGNNAGAAVNNGANAAEIAILEGDTCQGSPLNLARNLNTGNVSVTTRPKGTAVNSQCTLVSEIAKAREHIKSSLEKMDGIANLAATPVASDVLDRIQAVEKENANLRKLVDSLKQLCLDSQHRIGTLEQQLSSPSAAAVKTAANTVPVPAAKKPAEDDDDGVDLFASDSEEDDAEATRIREERLAAYAAKKSKKPALIAKSSLVLDVKPWDDETDLKAMEMEIRKIVADGLLWGASKFVPVAFGIQKLSISCVVEDEKISIDWLTEEIEKFEDFVQSVDVAAFNKI